MCIEPNPNGDDIGVPAHSDVIIFNRLKSHKSVLPITRDITLTS